jgi:hypothetical protein
MKTIVPYTNLLSDQNGDKWIPAPGQEDKIWTWTIAEDPKTGFYTRLTKFAPGCDTSRMGAADHDYQEEVLILSGDLHDSAYNTTLKAGDYTCRPLHEKHGPFQTKGRCIVLEIAYPMKAARQ